MRYRAYHKEIVGNVIAYIADRYFQKNSYLIYQMVMYKILAFFDFQCVTEQGKPCTELDFRARKMGPVPEELYNNADFESSLKDFFITIKDNQKKQYKCVCKPDLDYISPKEKEILDSVIDRFLTENIDAKKASDLSHEEISAWKKAYDRTPNSQMLYADEFDKNIFTVDEEDLTLPEYTLKMYNEFANA